MGGRGSAPSTAADSRPGRIPVTKMGVDMNLDDIEVDENGFPRHASTGLYPDLFTDGCSDFVCFADVQEYAWAHCGRYVSNEEILEVIAMSVAEGGQMPSLDVGRKAISCAVFLNVCKECRSLSKAASILSLFAGTTLTEKYVSDRIDVLNEFLPEPFGLASDDDETDAEG